jgi:hypothetical protein
MPELDLDLEFPDRNRIQNTQTNKSANKINPTADPQIDQEAPQLTSTFPGKCPQVTNNHSPISLLTSFLGVNPSMLCMIILGTG